MQVETWRKIETRRGVILKQRIHSTQLRRKYSELYHEVKNITKLDKRKFVERLAEEAEEFAGR